MTGYHRFVRWVMFLLGVAGIFAGLHDQAVTFFVGVILYSAILQRSE